MSIKTLGGHLHKILKDNRRFAREETKRQLVIKDGVATGKGLKSLRTMVEESKLIVFGFDYLDDFDLGQNNGAQPNLADLAAWKRARGVPHSVEKIADIINEKGTIKRFYYKGANFTKEAISIIVDKIVSDIESADTDVLEVELMETIKGQLVDYDYNYIKIK